MKNNLLALRAVIRNVNQFSSLGVKIIVQSAAGRPNCSAYQKLDKSNATANKMVMPKILRKCLRQFSTSSKRMFQPNSTSAINNAIINCWNCTEKQPANNDELNVFCRNCGLIREIGDSERVNDLMCLFYFTVFNLLCSTGLFPSVWIGTKIHH